MRNHKKKSGNGRVHFHAKNKEVFIDFSFKKEEVTVTGTLPVKVVTSGLVCLLKKLDKFIDDDNGGR
ncbi:MAG: hypothetical protein ABI430_03015 [Candidatus Taylorbacteria bacterium]